MNLLYKALYRKWRPMSFDDVISQQHITETLKNQVRNGKTAHAYLFTGSRGTGKTTCARILAKAVNCSSMTDGNPCLECDICHNADIDSLADIVEIDAASNRSINDIRDLRDGTIYTPERCKYKVYIIDEVHMLTPEAFNALLKIMEEPPEYVKFILATTEIHKVPATITSRCQRYDFRRIKPEDIADRLSYIANQEGLNLTKDGAFLIAKLADGGMRDAISLLDQCSVCAEEITSETVSAVAGIAGREYLYDIIESFSNEDTPKALGIINNLYSMSKDLLRLCEELIMQMRNLMLLKVSPASAEELISCMPDEMEHLKKLCSLFEINQIMTNLDILQDCHKKMGRVLNKRVELEMAVIRLCRKNPIVQASTVQADNSEVLEKIKKLENQIKTASFNKDDDIVAKPMKNPAVESEPKPNVDVKSLKIDELPEFEAWGKIFEEFKKVNPAVSGSLEGASVKNAGNVLLITAVNRFFITLFKKPENAMSLGETIYRVTGQRYAIRARCLVTKDEQRNMAESLIEKAKANNIEITEE